MIVNGVAGTTVPAFVERRKACSRSPSSTLCVAGTTVPAFVERYSAQSKPSEDQWVSPGLRSRPSLSAGTPGRPRGTRCLVSPGLRSRPSLSGLCRPRLRRRHRRCVAGTTVPAFVERTQDTSARPAQAARVAGTTVPAFVEREDPPPTVPAETYECRRDYGPGLR